MIGEKLLFIKEKNEKTEKKPIDENENSLSISDEEDKEN